MKKNIIGIAAVVLAFGMTAFTSPQLLKPAPVDSFFWYSPDGQTFLGEGELPSTGCHTNGSNCAKGYSSLPSNPVTDPPVIRKANP